MGEKDMGGGRDVGRAGWRKKGALDTVVDNEKGCRGGRGAKEDGGKSGVDATDGLSEGQARSRRSGEVACLLKTGFDGIERVERTVNGETSDGTGLSRKSVSADCTGQK